MDEIIIIDYGSGNLRSVAKAFGHVARARNIPVRVSDRPADLTRAARLVLPGVGAFAHCRRALAAVDGMIPALEEAVLARGRPFLGICVGMQLMAEEGREHETAPGLGWIGGHVAPIAPRSDIRIPQIGWNSLCFDIPVHPVLAGLGDAPYFYFVHGYVFHPTDPHSVRARCRYVETMTAAVGRDNMLGVQFHPEKSQKAGLQLIANFLDWRP